MPRARGAFFLQWRALLCLEALVSLLAVAGLLAPVACRLAQARPQQEPSAEEAQASPHDHHESAGQPASGPDDLHGAHGAAGEAQLGTAGPPHGAELAAIGAMSHEHMEMGGHPAHIAHMKMTAPHPLSPRDERRAGEIVASLRAALAKYRDYKAAIADGYQPFLPKLPQRVVHFTNWWHGFAEAFTFEPARPTSLLYEKTSGGGYRLKGAMYTAPKSMSEEQLDERVPLSVTSWHQHVDICLPRPGEERSADWRRFGFAGSISTPEECAAAGGVFHPVIFGWMVHVYPFADTPQEIWAR